MESKATKIAEGIWQSAVNIHEKGYLFEGIWPIPDGVSINSYTVKGEKTAVIDLTQDHKNAIEPFCDQLTSSGTSPEKIDYLILNHMEPDHTGFLRQCAERNPHMQLFCTEKAVPLVKEFYGFSGERVHAVQDGESLNLGGGKELTFYLAPNIHWPETMVTYEKSNKILFSCDGFGSYGKMFEGRHFDDQLSPERLAFFEKESIRYYANIVASFSLFVERAIKKLGGLDIKIVAPSHGIIWRKDPAKVISNYVAMAGYSKGECEPEITFIWGSMYGNTARMMKPVLEGIRSEGVPVHIYRVPQDHVGFIMADAFKSSGIVLGMPTYEYEMFPPMAHILEIFAMKKFKKKNLLRFGSYGWSGGAEKKLSGMISGLDWNIFDPVEWQGCPSDKDLEQGFNQGKALAKTVSQQPRRMKSSF